MQGKHCGRCDCVHRYDSSMGYKLSEKLNAVYRHKLSYIGDEIN